MEEKYYATLCNNHNVIIDILSRLKRQTKDKETKALLQECLDFARFCKKQGQHMENRMKNYRNAIESLGFVRSGGKF